MSANIKKGLFYFFIFAIAGYIWEVLVNLITLSRIANPGTMYGPWLPIYGWFVVILLLMPDKLKDKPIKVFIVSFILVGIIEYTTSAFLEHFYHQRWWNYSKYLFDIKGRVCLEALTVFATLAVIIIKCVIPKLNKLYKKMDSHVFEIVLIILSLFFVFDYGYSVFNPHQIEKIELKELLKK